MENILNLKIYAIKILSYLINILQNLKYLTIYICLSHRALTWFIPLWLVCY